MSKIFCKVTGSGCTWQAVYYFEIASRGSKEEQLHECQQRYEERFGVFTSHYCEQCFDSTSLEYELLSPKLSKKFFRSWLSKPERFEGAEVFRL